jgi:hypothetical protein
MKQMPAPTPSTNGFFSGVWRAIRFSANSDTTTLTAAMVRATIARVEVAYILKNPVGSAQFSPLRG